MILLLSYSFLNRLVQKFSEHRLLGLLVANGDFNSCASLLVIMKNLAVENGFKNIICFCPGMLFTSL